MAGDCWAKCRCSAALALALLLGSASCGRTHAGEMAGGAAGATSGETAGQAGATALEPDDTELEPYLNCPGAYQGLPVETPASALPTVLQAELCNARDSRVWAIQVVAGRAVLVTVENPLSVDNFRLSIHRSDVDDYEPLPITAGVTSAELGRLAERSLTFTPTSSGDVSLYAGLGNSRGEATRLRVEQ